MCATERGRARGMVMILVLVLVALLLIVALAVIAASNTSAQSTSAVSIKYRVLNSAEGAMNFALNDLETNPNDGNGTTYSGTLNGVPYSAEILENNLNRGSGSATDPATGNPITVAQNSAYLFGTASDQGGHTVYVEAIAGPAPPLTLPPGAVNAAHDIMDLAPMPIYQSDLAHPNNADLYANNNILVSGSPSAVQGDTFAGGSTDQLPGADGVHANQSQVLFPSASQVTLAVQNAKLITQVANTYTGGQIAQAGTQTYSGNSYVNGDLVIGSGTVTFASGSYVYVNGDLCIGGTGKVVDANSGASEFVVAGNVEIAGGGTYTASAGQNTLMLVLGADGPSAPCSGTNAHAVDLTMNGQNSIGTIFAPNGSIDVMGSGSISGALDAGANVRLEGSATGPIAGMQYDLTQASTTMTTGALTYNSYIEY